MIQSKMHKYRLHIMKSYNFTNKQIKCSFLVGKSENNKKNEKNISWSSLCKIKENGWKDAKDKKNATKQIANIIK